MKSKIDSTAIVHESAKIHNTVEIGPYSIVHENVVINANTKIGSFCELGISTELCNANPLIIGKNSIIRSHSVFYKSSEIGAHCTTGHNVIVRENTITGEYFQIGTNTEIQGDCNIGNYVRFQSNVFVSKKTTLGNFIWVLPYVIFANDPTPPSNDIEGSTIHDYATIAAGSIIMPGIIVGEHSLIAAGSCVTKNVDAYNTVAGIPSKVIGDVRNIIRRDGSGMPAYPWPRHFHRGYPAEVIKKWITDYGDDK